MKKKRQCFYIYMRVYVLYFVDCKLVKFFVLCIVYGVLLSDGRVEVDWAEWRSGAFRSCKRVFFVFPLRKTHGAR